MAQWVSDRWCWTINAPKDKNEDEQEAYLLEVAEKVRGIDCKYICYKGERVSCGHLQGYIEFVEDHRMKVVKSLFPVTHVHLTKARGDWEQNHVYITKLETAWRIPFYEKGTPKKNPGTLQRPTIKRSLTREEISELLISTLPDFENWLEREERIHRPDCTKKRNECVC